MTPHSYFLKKALEQAQERRGFCAPNPSVGAVLVCKDKLIATGFHYEAGYPHAEIDAIKNITNIPHDSTLYVTLEPCCHTGKTPPCTDAIIQAGIKKVVYAYRDPNPLVIGKGEATLKANNIECIHLPIQEIDAFYRSYTYWQNYKKPWIKAKLAMTLDGKIAGQNNQPISITGPELQAYTHQQRKQSDAILTTAKTILYDNPQLNVREPQQTIAKPLYVLDSKLTLSAQAQIFKTAKTVTIFHTQQAPIENITNLIAQGARCIPIETNDQNLLNLNHVVQQIGVDGIHDLWVEAGPNCFHAFINESLAHEALIYIAPWMLGEGIPAFPEKLDFRNRQIHWQQIGGDLVCHLSTQ